MMLHNYISLYGFRRSDLMNQAFLRRYPRLLDKASDDLVRRSGLSGSRTVGECLLVLGRALQAEAYELDWMGHPSRGKGVVWNAPPNRETSLLAKELGL